MKEAIFSSLAIGSEEKLTQMLRLHGTWFPKNLSLLLILISDLEKRPPVFIQNIFTKTVGLLVPNRDLLGRQWYCYDKETLYLSIKQSESKSN